MIKVTAKQVIIVNDGTSTFFWALEKHLYNDVNSNNDFIFLFQSACSAQSQLPRARRANVRPSWSFGRRKEFYYKTSVPLLWRHKGKDHNRRTEHQSSKNCIFVLVYVWIKWYWLHFQSWEECIYSYCNKLSMRRKYKPVHFLVNPLDRYPHLPTYRWGSIQIMKKNQNTKK